MYPGGLFAAAAADRRTQPVTFLQLVWGRLLLGPGSLFAGAVDPWVVLAGESGFPSWALVFVTINLPREARERRGG